MTKKTLLKKLIAHYTKAGEEMTEENKVDKMFEYNIIRGICHCANIIFDADIYNGEWVKYWVGYSADDYWADEGFWLNPQAESCNLHEALETIEYRIFIMTMELESGVE